MKIDVKIKWLIDEPRLDIAVDKLEVVAIDSDYVESDEFSVTQAVDEELANKYGVSFYACQDDYVIKNLEDVIEELAYDEFQDKVDPGYVE